MTRRNYCAVCDNEVDDCDVQCDKCDESFCYNCPIANDTISKLALVFAKYKVLDDNKDCVLSESELKDFILHLNSDDFIFYINNCDYLKDKIKTKIFTLVKQLNTNVVNITQNTMYIYNFIEKIIKSHVDLKFTCNMCFHNIIIQY